MSALQEGLLAVREGRMSFDAFVMVTRIHWEKLSAQIRRQWDIPVFIAREDIEQDMLLAAWTFIDRYDQTRGRTIEDFVVWNAYDKAKKAVHRARGANQHRNTDKNKSRYEMTESSLVRDGDDDSRVSIETLAIVEAPQHGVIERKERGARINRVCLNTRELLTMQALTRVGDSMNAAASLLFEDRTARRVCKLTSIEKANKVVERAVRDVAERVQYLSL